MTSNSSASLSVKILRFALNPASEPKEDVVSSRSLGLEILKKLSSEDDEEWESNLATLIEPLAQEIIGSPSRWSQVIRRVHIYLDSADTLDEHPRRQLDFVKTRGSEQTRMFDVPLDLSQKLVSLLLTALKPDQLRFFFETLDDWEVFRAVSEVLETIELDTKSLVALLHRADLKTRNDLTRGRILGPIQRKVTEAPAMGRQIVDAWLSEEDWAVSLDLPAISLLVEAAVENDPTAMEWRDSVIQVLVNRKTTDHLGLAAYLACFAWPAPKPSVEKRHASLMGYVERWPSDMIDIGLNAMVREASQYPKHAIQTAIKLIELVPADMSEAGEVRKRRAQFLARVCFYAANALKERGHDLAPLLLARHHLLFHPPPSSQDIDLDSVLRELIVDHPNDVKLFLMDWILVNNGSLEGQSLGEMFHLTVVELGVEQEAEWLASLMLSPARALRYAASLLMAYRATQTPIPAEYLCQLTAEQALAIAYQLSGSGTPGSVWVPALFHIARERGDVRRELVEFILQYAVPDYPGLCKEQIMTWETDESQPVDVEPLVAGLQDDSAVIRAALERDQAVHNKRLALREMAVSTGSFSRWRELFQRRMQVALDEEIQSGRHPLAAIIPRVPLARGSGYQPGADRNDVVPLSRFSHSMEESKRESFDRVAAAMFRMRHLERVERLLRDGGSSAE